jgi:N-carbamoylputrescine amidase
VNAEGPVRLAVCEGAIGMTPGDNNWRSLAADAADKKADMLLLNEMPFGPWVAAKNEPQFDELVAVQRLHEQGLEHYGELGTPVILGSHPVFDEGSSVIEGFVWERESGVTPAHTKQYFPNEEGWYETLWFERGDQAFEIVEVGGLNVAFLLCTDIMFNEWARHYGREGADLIVVPRATPVATLHRWQTAIQMAAVVSGCYVASSNRAGEEEGVTFGGLGWIVDPSGVVIAETSADEPVVAADIYRSVAAHAKREYPCYVDDSPPSDPEATTDDL